MGEWDALGKSLLRAAAGVAFVESGPTVRIGFGDGAGSARIDGTIGSDIAVEIESRVPKQVRGAVLDLILHPYPKKLLLLLPIHTGNPRTAARPAEVILGRLAPHSRSRVVVLPGDPEQAVRHIRSAIVDLRATEPPRSTVP